VEEIKAMSAFYENFQSAQPRHKVFVSYYLLRDQVYRDRFEYLFANVHDVMVSKSVQIGDVDPNLKTETLRQKIRDEYLHDSTVTVVLIGAETWKRKHVDWEIGASIRHTQYNTRSGLMGIILPTYPRSDQTKYDPYTIPPRLYDNIKCGFAAIYNWSENAAIVQKWIHEAFERRNRVDSDNSFPSFVNNHSGDRWQR
jgi:hypothetical protein